MKKKLIPVLIVLVLAVAGYSSLRLMKKQDSNVIPVSGNIELTEVTVSFKLPGKLIERTVDEGDCVHKAMLLARLDRDQLSRQQERAQAQMISAESRLTQLRTSIQFQTENLAGQIAQREAELRQAQAVLGAMLAGSRAQDVEQAKAQAEAARTAYDKAKKDWERAQTLFKNEDISASDFDRFKSAYESASAGLKQANERLNLVVEGPRKEDIDAGRAQVERARAALRVAEASRLDLRRMQEETQSRRAEIEQARADAGVVASQLSDTVAVSPIDGVVLVKSAEVGEVLAAGTPVLTIGDLEHPWLRAYINEQDLGRVKIGSKVRVTTDSFPGKVYRGRVSFISSQAEFTPKQIQTKDERVKLVYRVKIDVENANGELKSNMPADAEIVLN
jgi:HlyD family secretion protein